MKIENKKSFIIKVSIVLVIALFIVIKSIASQMPESKEEFIKGAEIAFKDNWDDWKTSVENTYDGEGFFGKQELEIKEDLLNTIESKRLADLKQKAQDKRKQESLVISEKSVKKVTQTYTDVSFKVTNKDAINAIVESAIFELEFYDAAGNSIGAERATLKNRLSPGLTQLVKVSTDKDVKTFDISIIEVKN